LPFSTIKTKCPGSADEEYRAHYLRSDIVQARVGIALFMAPMAVFIFKDFDFFGFSGLFYKLLILRVCSLLTGILLLHKLGKVKDYKAYDRYLFFAGLAAIGAISLLNLSRPPDYYIFVAVDMAVMAVIYTIIPTKLVNQCILGLVFSVSDILIIWFTRDQSIRPMLVTIVPGFLLVNSVGIVSSWLLQTFRRGQFNAQFEEEKARLALVTLAMQLEDAQAVAKVGSWVYSPDTTELTWSNEMYNIYGAVRSERKINITELTGSIPTGSWDKLKTAMDNTLKTGNPYEIELEITRPDGVKRVVLSRGQVKPNASDSAIMLIGTSQDITEIKRKEEIISASLREKEILLKEIQHRVKNNMQVISSMLSMQAQYARDESDARMFQDSQDRIRSMSLVYDQLRRSQDLAGINIKEYVNELISNLINSYRPDACHVSSQIDVDDISVDLDLAVPCGLLINELVTNSLKHAFKDKSEGIIRISMHKTSNNMLDVTVADNGIGLPENLDVASSPTLGMTLLHTLSEQLGAKVEFRRSRGTEFHTSFHINAMG
jgi:two-component sensor histidine kinase/PAS domain-containing protein